MAGAWALAITAPGASLLADERAACWWLGALHGDRAL